MLHDVLDGFCEPELVRIWVTKVAVVRNGTAATVEVVVHAEIYKWKADLALQLL